MDHAWLFVLIAIPSAFVIALVWAYLMRSSRIRSSGTAKVYVSSVEESSRAANSSGGDESGGGQADGN